MTTTTRPDPQQALQAAVPAWGRALQPGVVLLGPGGEPQWADERALALLGCGDGGELAARWQAIRQRLQEGAAPGPRPAAETAGTSARRDAPDPGIPETPETPETPEIIELPAETTGGRRVRVSLVRAASAAAPKPASGSPLAAAGG
ncbi:MAG: hypothetical protein JOZ15_03525, partial [Acidobacteria bacterium]|nr:hypothetical protein [Acidobacteriota bacterium]